MKALATVHKSTKEFIRQVRTGVTERQLLGTLDRTPRRDLYHGVLKLVALRLGVSVAAVVNL